MSTDFVLDSAIQEEQWPPSGRQGQASKGCARFAREPPILVGEARDVEFNQRCKKSVGGYDD
jgi:hypothetical protein